MKQIPLTNGGFTLVDDEDFEFLSRFTWSRSDSGYVTTQISVRGKNFHQRMHRIIMLAPDGILVDHRDRDKLNNQKSNLRFCTKAENGFNCVRRGRSSTSPYPLGVSKAGKGSQKFRARLVIDGKEHYLGQHDTVEAAHHVVIEASKRLHGEFSPYTQKVRYDQ